MAKRLELAQIEKELSDKNLHLVSAYEDYKSLNSPITVGMYQMVIKLLLR